MLKFSILSVFVCFAFQLQASIVDDTLKTGDSESIYNTKRAAILSTFIPGAGQLYNEIGYRKISNKKHRAWWKIPLIYGGLGACGYYFYHNNQFANLTKQEYLYQVDNPGHYLDERFKNYPTDPDGSVVPDELIVGYTDGNQVEHLGYDTYAKRRDIFIFAFIGVWGLNVLEAYVDAHFVTFDVSEDLSMSWHPTLLAGYTPALSLQFNFN